MNSCIYSIHVFIIFEYMYVLFLTIKLFLCFIGERDTLRSVQLRIVYILLASERSERDTLRSVQLRIGDILLLYNMVRAILFL